MRGILSLQERLALLVAAAILPLSVLSVWIAVREIDAGMDTARSQLKFAASLVAAHQDRGIDAAEQLLGAISGMPQAKAGDAPDCGAYFASLRELHPIYANIGLFDLQGNVRCHANGRAGDFSAADRDYFRRAVAERRFVMGASMIGRSTRLHVLPFARPVFDGDRLVAVAFASIDLDRAGAALARIELPASARVLVVDRRGAVLMALPPRPELAAGATSAIIEEAARSATAGASEARDVVGDPRVFAYAPARSVAGENLVAIVSLKREEVAATTRASLRDELIAILVTLVASVAVAWWFGGRSIVKPAKQVLGAVRRLEQGRLEARVPTVGPQQRGEFARIGAAFNLMAESLQLRQLDLENELRRSRSAYAVLDHVLNSMQEPLVAMNADGDLLMHNEAARRMFPLDEPVPPAMRPQAWGLYRPDGLELYTARELPLSRALRGESGSGFPLVVRNALVPQGRTLQCSFQPVHGAEGVTAALAVFTDITELRDSERELHDYTQMLQRAANAAVVITALPTLQETMQQVAEQARHVIPSHLAVVSLTQGADWSQAITSVSMSARYEAWRDYEGQPDGSGIYALVCETNQPLRLTQEALENHPRWRGLGAHAPAHPPLRGLLALPLTGRNGENIGLLQLSDKESGDYTERDQYVAMEIAQLASIALENARLFTEISALNLGLEARIAERTAELARQEQLYRTLAEQAPEIVWNTDASGERLTFLNRAWYELVGGTPEDWLDRSGLDAIHPDDRQGVSANWQRSRARLAPFIGVRRIRARDGTYHTMSYKGAPVLDHDGQVVFWVGIDTDITDLKSIEHALRATNQELEAFSYSVSHDLRAPLGVVAGFSKALETKLGDQADERTRHYVARIQAGVLKMEQLIEALLSLSRVARAQLAWTEVDLSAQARDILDELHLQDPDRSVAATVEDGLVVQGDARLLRVALQNLLGNAWKFSAQRPDARIEVGRADGAFYVRDNGVGFDMQYADKLFVAFQRLHTEAEFPGTGIGLATVRRIVGRHQGRVWAQSREGEGTSFFFTLSDTPPPAWMQAHNAGSG